jgi:hypothetical protein
MTTTKEIQVRNYSLDKIDDVKKMAVVLRDFIKKNNLSVNIAGRS